MGITEERLERIEKQVKVMESFGDAAVDISSELDAILQDNYQMEQQIEFLLETNDRLRKQLDSDAHMKLPLDADGVPIRIGDEIVDVFDEHVFVVDGYCKFPTSGKMGFTVEGGRGIYEPSVYQHKKAEPADSWEKLEKDAMGSACELSGSGHLRCGDCEWGKEDIGCQAMARLEILKRAKKLAGIEEEAQR